jgi:hypothetical protein
MRARLWSCNSTKPPTTPFIEVRRGDRETAHDHSSWTRAPAEEASRLFHMTASPITPEKRSIQGVRGFARGARDIAEHIESLTM